jgi:hypothetical protein
MVEQGWIPSEVTQVHLQDLVSQGFMMAVEHLTCHVLKDPTSPMLAGGYVVACASFYKRGFGLPSH